MVEYATALSFFPQLLAGPITRPRDLLPQLFERRAFDDQRARDGLRQILWGLTKKMLVADNIGVQVDYVWSNIGPVDGLTLAIAALLYSIQIYCDFSGYADIAIGTAKLFNLRLSKNFDYPYFSTSVRMFWRRWHITLASWMRDYVYIPLGGSRVGAFRRAFNVLVTFLVVGLWHGANWTFVVWGLLHGSYLVVEGRTASSEAADGRRDGPLLGACRRRCGRLRAGDVRLGVLQGAFDRCARSTTSRAAFAVPFEQRSTTRATSRSWLSQRPCSRTSGSPGAGSTVSPSRGCLCRRAGPPIWRSAWRSCCSAIWAAVRGSMFSSRRGPVLFLLRVVVFLLVFTALAEVWLRTVTPASETPLSYQDTSSMIIRFDPTGPREGLYTVGRMARRGGQWRVNNAGWISAVDYAPAAERERPLIALFGDSYIEGFLTDVDQHIDAYLPELLESRLRRLLLWARRLVPGTVRRHQSLRCVALSARPDSHLHRRRRRFRQRARERSGLTELLADHGSRRGFRRGRAHGDLQPEPRNAAGKKSGNRQLPSLQREAECFQDMRNAAIPEPATGADAARRHRPARFCRRVARAAAGGRLHGGAAVRRASRDTRSCLSLTAIATFRSEAVSGTPLFADALAVQAACNGRPQCHFLDLRLAFSRTGLPTIVASRRRTAATGTHTRTTWWRKPWPGS